MIITGEMRTGCGDIVARFALYAWLSSMCAIGFAANSGPPTNAAAIHLNLRGAIDKSDAFTPKKAKQLATQYARDHKLDWGEAEKEVDRKDVDTYWVFFKTPKKEEKLLWKRVLVVKRDGTISYLPRR